MKQQSNQIGTLNEGPLHAAIKNWYAKPGDQMEVKIDGYVIDLVRENLLIEIQTGSFSALKRKLRKLTQQYSVHLIHPIAYEKWIVKQDQDGKPLGKQRKSPKRGQPVDIFKELVSFPKLIQNTNFSLEVLLIQEEEVRYRDAKRGWRRKGWVIQERRLIKVLEQHEYHTADDLLKLLPDELEFPFTTASLSAALKRPRRLAQQMAYCLRKMGVIEIVGKQGNAHLYEKS